MLDQDTRDLLAKTHKAQPSAALARRLIPLLDLTNLDSHPAEAIDALCGDAVTPHGTIAAVCVLPGFVRHARAALTGTGVKVATVIDFPAGNGSPEDIMRETDEVVREGAEEIGLVFPYRRFLADTPPPASKNVRGVRDAGGYDIRLKVILEAGVYPDAESLAAATEVAIQSGADFLEISTGTHETGDPWGATSVILSAIAASGLPVGFKADGVEDTAMAACYLMLAESMLGDGWAAPGTFRIGTRGLLSKLFALL